MVVYLSIGHRNAGKLFVDALPAEKIQVNGHGQLVEGSPMLSRCNHAIDSRMVG